MSITSRQRDWLLLGLLGLIWGASFPAMSLSLDGYPPFTIAALRITAAAVLLTIAAILTGASIPGGAGDARLWAFAAGMGLFYNALPFGLLAWGLQNVSAAFAGITMALSPVLTVALAHVLIPGEVLTWRRAAGVGLAVIGAIVLIGPDTILSDQSGLWPRLACIGVACCYSIGSIITRLAPPADRIGLSAASLICGAMFILPVMLLLEGIPNFLGAPVLANAALGYLALVPTAIATFFVVIVVRSSGPGFLAQVNYQVPLWAMAFGMLITGDELHAEFLIALALILLGLALSQTQPRKPSAPL